MAGSVRKPENPTGFWKKVFRYDFGISAILACVIAWILIIVWIETEQMGGLTARDSSGVTKGYFNWHPLLMSTAFLLFMAPAIVAFEVYPMARSTNKNMHGILMGVSFMAAIAGLAIILDCHNTLSDTGSFKTLHGCVGLFTLIILVLNYLGGFVMYVLKLGGSLRATLKPFHKRLGFFCMMMGFATICIGVQEKADKGSLSGWALSLTYGIGILVYLALACVVFAIAKFSDKADVSTVDYSPIKHNDRLTAADTLYGSNAPSADEAIQAL